MLMLQSWPKCVRHYEFYAEFLQYSLPPPSTPDAMLDDRSGSLSFRTTLHGGREVEFGPKNVFPCEKRPIVEAVHSARVSNIILATIVALTNRPSPSTSKKKPLGFFCRSLMAFSVISAIDGSPAMSSARLISYCMLDRSKRPE